MTSGNPFKFNYIHDLTSIDDFTDSGPSVVMATPGMLQVYTSYFVINYR